MLIKLFCRISNIPVHEFENPNEEQKIIKWEKIMTNELINQQESKRKDCVDFKVDESHEKYKQFLFV